MSISVIPGVATLAGAYDGYILDMWGVLYDGGTVWPWARQTMRRLRDGGARLVVLSNGPRRATAVARRLAEAGIPEDEYDGVMSSGEEAWQCLAGRRADPWYEGLGRRCLFIGSDGDRGMLDGLDVTLTDDPATADFILNLGIRAAHETVADFEPVLRVAAARHVRMVCANPDLVVHRLGRVEICAGSIAERYEELGGAVRWHGKPHRSVYDSVLALMPDVPRDRVLAVGDSFRTDIRGANGAGIDSLLVAAGIHFAELCDADGRPDPARIARLSTAAGAVPTYACGKFEWQAQ